MDERVTEFHSIMPIENLPSVLEHGILSHEKAAQLPHRSVAEPRVQERREVKKVPCGLPIHRYANLYFHARNPMMYQRQEEAPRLCVLRISMEIRLLPGVVFADRNASSDWVRFLTPQDWRLLDFDAIHAISWTHSDTFQYLENKSKKCAEVLVPNLVETPFIEGAYVLDHTAATKLRSVGFTLPISINPWLFFR